MAQERLLSGPFYRSESKFKHDTKEILLKNILNENEKVRRRNNREISNFPLPVYP